MADNSIYLIGFMGAGKTSVGQALGELSGYPVIDTDELIVKQEGMAITELFKQHGEEHFREIESAVLTATPSKKTVITTGGGIILKESNRGFLKKQPVTIFLECNPASIMKRLENDTTRPLMVNKSFHEIQEMYSQRLPLYKECASSVIDTTHYTVDEIAKIILARMFPC